MVAARKSARFKIPLIVVVLAVVLVVIFIARSRPGTSRLAQRAWGNLAAAESFHTSAELKLHLPALLRGKERPFTEVLAQVEGDVSYTDEGTPELTGTLYTEAKGRGTIFFADGDTRILDNEVRFRLDNLPVFLHRSGSLVDRWTRVATPLLTTNNPDEVAQALEIIFESLTQSANEDIDGERLVRFTGAFSAEEEGVLVSLFDENMSGNSGLNVLSRLLAANNVESFDVWVDSSPEEIRRIKINFGRPLRDETVFDFATLTLAFSDYGKDVAVDRPETKLVVESDVFAKLFGEGDIGGVE